MNFKKTLTFSLFFHICFFAAALLLSANLLGGSSKVQSEKVFFVKLTEEIGKVRLNDFLIETEKKKPKRSAEVKREPLPVNKREVTEKPQEMIQEDHDKTMQADNKIYDTLHNEKILTKADKNTLFKDEGSDESSFEFSESRDTYTVTLQTLTYAEPGSEYNGEGLVFADIINSIRDSIERTKVYPLLARKRGFEGTTYVGFTINQHGIPQDLQVIKSSGYRILDDATIRIVKKAAPFPHIESSVEVPVVYKLRSGE